MSANPLDENNSILIANLHHKAVVIPLDVEDNSIVGKEISGSIAILDVLRRLPVRSLYFDSPRTERCLRVGVLSCEEVDYVGTGETH